MGTFGPEIIHSVVWMTDGKALMNDVASYYRKWVVTMTKSNTFAVEVRPQEALSTVAELILRTAHSEGLKFLKMEFLDTFTVGTRTFGRFRIDDYIGDLVEKINDMGRGVILVNEGTYQIRIGDRKAPIPISTMHAISRSPSRYRGPGAQHWDRQFQ